VNASRKDLPVKPPGDDPDSHTMPLLDHLMELRRRLMYSIIALIVAFLGSFYYSQTIYDFLAKPLADAMTKVGGNPHMIYTHLAEAFLTQVQVALFAAAFVTFPIFANQIWRFVAPGLYKHEKNALLPFLFAAPVLFFMGGALAYYVIMPMAWKFLLGFQNLSPDAVMPIEAQLKVGDYLSIFMTLIFAFGLAFQMPVLLVLLAKVGILSSKTLSTKRRYAVIGIFIFAAVVTPPDVISQLSLAVPMLILYELSIIGARIVEKKPEPDDEAPSDGSGSGSEDTDFNAA
jgi:sec-independent protein translocase protein TatC